MDVSSKRKLRQTLQQLAHPPDHVAAQSDQLGTLRLGLCEPRRGFAVEEELCSTISDDENV